MSYHYANWQSGERPPKGWDVADAIGDGWQKADLLSFMRETAKPWPFAPDAPAVQTETPVVQEVEVSPLHALIRDWCFLSGRGKFRNMEDGSEMRVDAFNLTYQRLIPEVDYSVAGRQLKTPKEVAAAEYLLHYANGARVQDTMYLPQIPGKIVEVGGVQYLNAYLPHLVPPAAAHWQGHWAVETWRGHLQNLLPHDWELLLTWIARNVQRPGDKILWAPIIKGVQGDGKSSISDMMGAVMGAENVRVVSTESLFSDFTGYAEGACVAFLEEIRVKGHNRHDAMNKLKPLVTNKVIEVVRKGQDGRNIPNVTNYLAFTNFEDALVIDANDRRWGVFFTRFAKREDLVEAGIGKAYWDKLHSAYELHPDVLRAWLLAVDTTGFDPKAAPPITAAKSEMIRNSLSAEASAIKELIALGRSGVGKHVIATDCLNAALKADGNPPIVTARVPLAFAELGWRAFPVPVKWNGSARRVYTDTSMVWPDDEASQREIIRKHLDETEATVKVKPDFETDLGSW